QVPAAAVRPGLVQGAAAFRLGDPHLVEHGERRRPGRGLQSRTFDVLGESGEGLREFLAPLEGDPRASHRNQPPEASAVKNATTSETIAANAPSLPVCETCRALISLIGSSCA